MNTERQMLATQFAQAVNRLGMLALLPQENEKPTQVQLDQWREEAYEVKNSIEFLLKATELWALEQKAEN